MQPDIEKKPQKIWTYIANLFQVGEQEPLTIKLYSTVKIQLSWYYQDVGRYRAAILIKDQITSYNLQQCANLRLQQTVEDVQTTIQGGVDGYIYVQTKNNSGYTNAGLNGAALEITFITEKLQ